MRALRSNGGFSLVEMAVVLAIVSLLVAGAVTTLASQVEQRNFEETQRRLNTAAEAILAFAIVNRRLPCPARYTVGIPDTHSQGLESFCTPNTGTCAGAEITIAAQPPPPPWSPAFPLWPPPHGNCSNFYSGYVPAATIGVQPVDPSNFMVDAWGNRIRYVISRDNTGCNTTPPANTRILTSQANLKTYGVGCKPNDLDVCNSTVGTSATSCNTATRVVSTQTAAFIVYSTGKNGAITSAYGDDETENTDGDPVFVSRTPSGSGSPGGTYDDLLVIVPVGVVYSKLISAGTLP